MLHTVRMRNWDADALGHACMLASLPAQLNLLVHATKLTWMY